MSKDVFFTYDFQYGSSSMPEEEAWAFLESTDNKTMILSTVGPDNIPQATPIYFHVHNKKIYFNMIKDPPKQKLRNILNNPYVCLTGDRWVIGPDGRPQFWFVSVIGTARVVASERSSDPKEQAFVKEYNSWSPGKYDAGKGTDARMKQRRSTPWGKVWVDVLERIYMEITPTKIVSYDARKKTVELFDKLANSSE
jgi:nitroimidazol reductase NimA-like FMN-containing flavoprotein (pyridoxamine 5'-phosphate oxidase superfamily)